MTSMQTVHDSDHAEGPPAARVQRTFEEICDRIRARIASGELKAGDKLPPERELAEQLGVGRNAVREALRSLEMAGVVRLEKGRSGGAFIRPANASRVTHAIRDLLDYGSIDWAELTEARTVLMDCVVKLACERATDADFEALECNLEQTDELTKAGRFEERSQRTTEFYTLLAGGAHNGALVLLATSMSDLVRRFLEIAVSSGERQPIMSLVASRRRFLRLLRERNAQAACAEMRSQLLQSHRLVQSKLDARPLRAPQARKAVRAVKRERHRA